MGDDSREICLVRIKNGGDCGAAFVIDGRRYRDSEDFRRVRLESIEELKRRWIIAEYEQWDATPTEPPLPWPSWEEYRQTPSPTKPH